MKILCALLHIQITSHKLTSNIHSQLGHPFGKITKSYFTFTTQKSYEITIMSNIQMMTVILLGAWVLKQKDRNLFIYLWFTYQYGKWLIKCQPAGQLVNNELERMWKGGHLKLEWSVRTCLTQLYDGRDMYKIYYIKNNYMFRHFTLAIFRLRNEKT